MTTENHANDQNNSSSHTLNKLRAAVLGANDGIVSISALIMGVAGATNDTQAIFTAGMAALVAGALSMAVGEYVSVSSQSDAEKAYIEKERQELLDDPEGELEELAEEYEKLGVSKETAHKVAVELTQKDALKAHLHVHFNLHEDDVASPIHAAVASFIAFSIGGLIPFLTIILSPEPIRLWTTGLAVLIALFATGYLSADVGGASKRRAITRVVIGGVLAMLVTYYVGALFGARIS